MESWEIELFFVLVAFYIEYRHYYKLLNDAMDIVSAVKVMIVCIVCGYIGNRFWWFFVVVKDWQGA